MARKDVSLAKVSRPRARGVSRRERLFHALDAARAHPAVWITGPAGSGKTTLISSYIDARRLPCLWYSVDAGDADLAAFFYYLGLAAKKAVPSKRRPLPLLTPEYLPGLPVFTRRFFEDLFSCPRPPFALVLDNYQDAGNEPGFHETVIGALSAVPEGTVVFVLSRDEPPAAMARLLANGDLGVVGWDELRLTEEESRELVGLRRKSGISGDALSSLHRLTDGWAAGLVLLITGNNFEALGENLPGGFDSASVFDYFANEIFAKTDEAVRSLLLKTSFLSSIGAEIAGHLTGNSHAAQILDRLSRDHYFTYRHRDNGAVYQYHPLFREFLRARAREVFSLAEIDAIRVEAALILADSGQTDEAIDLLLLAGRWDEAAGLIMVNAQAVAAQGRNKTLEGWLRRLPDERVRQEPWLAYWLAQCRMLSDPAGARLLLERAFAQFSEQDDAKGLYLSWAGIIDTFYLAWNEFGPVADRWIPEFEALSGRHPAFPSLEMEARVKISYFTALFWGKPQHPDLPKIVERLTQIMLNSSNHSLRFVIGSHVVLYHTWIGPTEKAKFVFDLLQPAVRRSDIDPLALHLWFGTTAMYAWLSAEHDACTSNIAHAVALGEKTGVRPFEHMLCGQGVCSALSQGDVAAAERFVARIAALDSPRRLDRSYYHNVAASVAWHRGDWKGAVAHGEQGLRSAEEGEAPLSISLSHLELAITWFDMGRIKEAEQGCARALAESAGLTLVEFVCRLFQAWFALEQGDTSRGIATLRQALAIGAEQGFVNYPRWRSGMMSRVCARALEEGIETDYVRDLIRRRGLLPEGPPEDCERWPWPVKINTLGRFEIFKDGKPFRFARKVPKKPIELLKALIAFGGRNVSETRLNDTLWPDAAGDASHRAFNITLIRLRELFDLKDAILLKDGCVTLDERYFRIDARVFERLLNEVDEKAGHGFLDKAFDLYKGPFLPDENGLWAITLREKLRGKFLGRIEKAGRSWEDKKKYPKAIECYLKGLETDDLFEEFYKRTMICYLRLGRKAEAVSIYRRCKKALSVHGLNPSLEAETIYNDLIS